MPKKSKLIRLAAAAVLLGAISITPPLDLSAQTAPAPAGSQTVAPTVGFPCPPNLVWVFKNGQAACDCNPATKPHNYEDDTCPAGYSGSHYWTRSVTCELSTGNWLTGSWVEHNNCTQSACTGTKPADDTRTENCPVGQTGQIDYKRSYSCSGAPAWSWNPGDWTETNNTCAGSNSCTGTAPASTQTLPCPPGYSGTGEQQARDVTCNNGTWEWGDWYKTADANCSITDCTGEQPATSEPIPCPDGTTGTAGRRERTVTCDNGTWVPGDWTTTQEPSCTAVCSHNGDVPWDNCLASYSGTVTEGTTVNLTNTASGYSGSISYLCTATGWSEQSRSCTANPTGCGAQSATWSSCSGSLGADTVGNTQTVSNTNSGYTGSASYYCGSSGWSPNTGATCDPNIDPPTCTGGRIYNANTGQCECPSGYIWDPLAGPTFSGMCVLDDWCPTLPGVQNNGIPTYHIGTDADFFFLDGYAMKGGQCGTLTTEETCGPNPLCPQQCDELCFVFLRFVPQ